MKKTFPIFFLLILLQGCWLVSRHWNLGDCQESSSGIYGCIVTVPKCSATVGLSVIIHRQNATNPPPTSMRIQIQNKESQIIEIQGKNPFIHLKPDESYELEIKPDYEINKGGICRFDTHTGAIRIAIKILSGRPDGATISIVGDSSDGI
jgi:hypothetical protein